MCYYGTNNDPLSYATQQVTEAFGKGYLVIGESTSAHLSYLCLAIDSDNYLSEEVYLVSKKQGFTYIASSITALGGTPETIKEVYEAEERLDVVLPTYYKSRLIVGNLTKKYHYTFFNSAAQLYNEDYGKTNDAKSVIIGEDGTGDAVGFLLQEDSDYELSPTAVEFYHETATLYPTNHIKFFLEK